MVQHEYGTQVETYWQEYTTILENATVPMLFCKSKSPHIQQRKKTWTSAVRSRRHELSEVLHCTTELAVIEWKVFDTCFWKMRIRTLGRIRSSVTIHVENFERNTRKSLFYTRCYIGTNSGWMVIKQFCHYFRQIDKRETEGQCLPRRKNSSSGNFNIVRIVHDAKFSESNQPYKHWNMNMTVFR